MTVILCYAPTNDSDDATKEDFYSALSRCLATVPPPHDITVLLGDFNATVRDDMGLWRGTVGPVSPTHLTTMGSAYLNCADLTTFTLQTPTSNANYSSVHMI